MSNFIKKILNLSLEVRECFLQMWGGRTNFLFHLVHDWEKNVCPQKHKMFDFGQHLLAKSQNFIFIIFLIIYLCLFAKALIHSI